MPISRRQFIAGTLAGLSVNPIVGVAAPSKKVGVALLGLGYYSTDVLAPAFKFTKHCELRGIVTGSPSKIPSWQKRYGISDGNVYTYDNMHTIANNDEIDVVYVVTPTATHLKFALMAAAAGKHVWCEKPMAMTVKECQEMITACKKNNVKLSIGYRMQHEPNTRAMAELGATNPFGNIQAVSAFAGYAGRAGPSDYWRMKPEMGGGALYDMGVYAINGVRYVTGLEPTAVKARIEHTAGFDHVDATTYFTLQLPSGVEADCGTSVVKGFNHLKIQCKNGWYELNPMQPYSGVVAKSSTGLVLPAFEGNQQAKQMDDDALAILLDKAVMVPGEEGLKDINIVEKAFISANSNQAFVNV